MPGISTGGNMLNAQPITLLRTARRDIPARLLLKSRYPNWLQCSKHLGRRKGGGIKYFQSARARSRDNAPLGAITSSSAIMSALLRLTLSATGTGAPAGAIVNVRFARQLASRV